jgi:AcrR family transcriptional regulator
MKKPSVPLRERKKSATRRALLAAANIRFHIVGFDATTIDEVCQDIGVSRRTFFRYFHDKESLAFPHRHERLQRFIELLDSSPASESPVGGLRRIAQIFAKEYTQNRDALVAQQRLVQTSPALLARENEIDRDWEEGMARAFRARDSSGADAELRARVLAGAAIGVIRATMRHWFASNGKPDLAKLGDEALDCLEQGFVPNRAEQSGRNLGPRNS